jgi:two-component system chemotaxis response regulator CheB
MPRDIIVIGASAGGIEALKVLVKDLPADVPASIFVVVHIGAYGLGILPEILARAGSLPASNAVDREPIRRGHIYVAPPDHHLLLDPAGVVRITRGPKENLSRPALDPLFRSAAYAFGPRVTGVVLTGYLDDGTAGLWAVREFGGAAIVQDPREAFAASMPQSALRHVDVDHCLPLNGIAPMLVRLATDPAEKKGAKPVSQEIKAEVKIAAEDNALEAGIMNWGEPSVFACPECHGVLMQLKEGSNLRFRCHTGHAYSIESLLADFNEQTEDALWNAIRAMEESILLMRRMAQELAGHKHREAAGVLVRKAEDAQRRAELVRSAVMNHEKIGGLDASQAGEAA